VLCGEGLLKTCAGVRGTIGVDLQMALANAGVAGYRAFLLPYEDPARENGEIFRFKVDREKCFLTPLVGMTPSRRRF